MPRFAGTYTHRCAHHAPRFKVMVIVPNLGEAEAEGSSKQEAETAAAAALLDKLS